MVAAGSNLSMNREPGCQANKESNLGRCEYGSGLIRSTTYLPTSPEAMIGTKCPLLWYHNWYVCRIVSMRMCYVRTIHVDVVNKLHCINYTRLIQLVIIIHTSQNHTSSFWTVDLSCSIWFEASSFN
jgi:hypothetical protein